MMVLTQLTSDANVLSLAKKDIRSFIHSFIHSSIQALKQFSNTVYSEIMTIETVNKFRLITGRKPASYEIPQSNTNFTVL